MLLLLLVWFKLAKASLSASWLDVLPNESAMGSPLFEHDDEVTTEYGETEEAELVSALNNFPPHDCWWPVLAL